MKIQPPDDFINFKSDEPCLSCGHHIDNEVCYHHIFTRKTHPEFTYMKWNQASTCSKCHTSLWHTKGTSYMSDRFPKVREWLNDNDWHYDDTFKKWRNSNAERLKIDNER